MRLSPRGKLILILFALLLSPALLGIAWSWLTTGVLSNLGDLLFMAYWTALLYLAMVLPLILLTYLTWRVTSAIRIRWVQVLIRSGAVALVITPHIGGHLVLIPAIYPALFDPHFIPRILAVWGTGFLVTLGYDRLSKTE